MALNIHINDLPYKEEEVEIVERKGLGHPDTICDLVADHLSIRLSQIYRKVFGTIPHFNIDKAFLAAGVSKNKFGGGKIVKPMLFIIGDRATSQVGKKKINLNKIIKDEIYAFLKAHYRFINKKNFVIQNEIKPGSSSLTDIFQRKSSYMPANDTSALVAFAPLTTLESMVYQVEHFINSSSFKKKHPESGEDIKVMGYKEGKDIRLIIAMAFVDKFVKNEDDYFEKKAQMQKDIEKFIEDKFNRKVSLAINTLDQKGKGINGCYLTVTGTSGDSGDSGEVGRGNRCNGLIPLNRHAGSEAAAGKNCVSHIGKIYNLLAFKIADDIYTKTGKRNYVWLTSQIGQPINEPALVSIQASDIKNGDKDKINKIVQDNFDKLDIFVEELIQGKYRTI